MAACLLCTLPVLLPVFPPMVDVPQHAAQIELFRQLQDPLFAYRDLFTTRLFTPYLFGYGLIALLAPVFGIVLACKLVIATALALLPPATRYFLRASGADSYWAWLVFPCLYGFSYQWGFINFLVAAPIGMAFLGMVWRRPAAGGWRSALGMILALYLLFFSHVLVLALFAAIATLQWWSTRSDLKAFVRSAWPLLTPLPLALLWLADNAAHPMSRLPPEWDLSWWTTLDSYYTQFAEWRTSHPSGWGRVSGLLPRLLGLRPDVLLTVAGLGLLLLPFAAGGQLTAQRQRYLPAVLIMAVLLLAPSEIFGVSFVFQRFTFLLLPLALAVIDAAPRPPRGRSRLRALAPVAATVWIGLMTVHALRFDDETRGFSQLLAQMEAGKRVLSLSFLHDDADSIAPTLVHLVAWYAALKGGVSDPSFAVTQVQPVVYAPQHMPTVRILGFEWFPQTFAWQYHAGWQYDYFVARAPADYGALLFRDASCWIDLVAQSGKWWLYRRAEHCPPPPSVYSPVPAPR